MRNGKRLAALAALAAAIGIALTGCGALETKYVSVKPHDEQYYNMNDSTDELVADSYLGLKNAMLSLIENREEFGIIRVYTYSGDDVEAGLESATYEVCKSDPLGAYAVEYLSHDCTLIVSYYEIHVYIKYRKTSEQIKSIVRIGGMSGIRNAMTNAFLKSKNSLVLRISSYSEEDDAADYDWIAKNCYRNLPASIVRIPKITEKVYPNSGIQRIIEYSFSYGETEENMTQHRNALAEKLQMMAENAPQLTQITQLTRITDKVTGQLEGKRYDKEALLYDLLCGESYNDESIVMAVSQICALMDIECQNVWGKKNNADYCWNIICLDKLWYHFDAAAAVRGDNFALCFDDTMLSYQWDRTQYPACTGIKIE
ncbi:MAG: hypothetical protein PHS97_04520 [Oscillospiraceae bacterium]|nr:hypothetical protein [Oscillospiraceae bacterium]